MVRTVATVLQFLFISYYSDSLFLLWLGVGFYQYIFGLFLLLFYQSFVTLRMSGSSERISDELACNMVFYYFLCWCLFAYAVGYQGIYTQSGVEIKKMGHLQMKNLALSEVTNEMDKLNRYVSVIKKKSEGGLKRTCTSCSAVDAFSPGHIGPFFRKHCLLYTSPSPRDKRQSRMPSSA